MTEQSTHEYVITSVARILCRLTGYPRLEFRGADGRRLRFEVRRQGDREIPGGPVLSAAIGLQFAGLLAFNAGPCETASRRIASRVRIALPDVDHRFEEPVKGAPLALCGRRDMVDVAPIEQITRSRASAIIQG